MRGVAMVAILSSHQQNAMVSTLNVLLLTLNKVLPGGLPRITKVSLMVRLIFSLNNSRAPWFLKLAEPLFCFHYLVEYNTRYKLIPISLRIVLNHASCFLYLFSYALV